MIFPIPHIYDFSFVAAPLWEREHTAEIKAKTPCDPSESSPEPSESDETQWAFKGYQWHLEATWYPFVNPGWDHFVDNDPDEIREREIRYEQERHALLQGKASTEAQSATAPDPVDPDARFGPPPVDPRAVKP